MIWITIRGAKYLVKQKVIGAKELLQHLIDGVTNQDKRRPKKEIYNDGDWKPMDPEEQRQFDGLLGIVTKRIS